MLVVCLTKLTLDIDSYLSPKDSYLKATLSIETKNRLD